MIYREHPAGFLLEMPIDYHAARQMIIGLSTSADDGVFLH